MNLHFNDIDKFKTPGLAAWLVAVMILLLGIRPLKELLLFIFMKLYEIFIQSNAFKP